MRRALKLPRDQLPDASLEKVFDYIDEDGSGEIHLGELLAFLEGDELDAAAAAAGGGGGGGYGGGGLATRPLRLRLLA